jgi:electron transfer flavoprotein alpha subunit
MRKVPLDFTGNTPPPLPLDEARDIWVIAEHLDGRVCPVTYEAAAFARKLASAVSGKVSVVVLGDSVEPLAREIAGKTGFTALGMDMPGFPEYQAEIYRWALRELCGLPGGPPAFLLTPHSPAGWDFAPALAVDLGASCITSVSGLRNDRGPVFSRPTCHGKLMEELRPAEGRPAVITLMPGAEKPGEAAPDGPGDVFLCQAAPPSPKARRVGRIQAPPDTTRMKDAEVIVAAGRGVGSPEQLESLRELAGLFRRSALGASRPLCDMGWLPFQHQVGMTGQTVSPRLYIACGISGAIQHTMGIRRADLVVVINTDPNALFCRQADCCVTEDLNTFLPLLAEKIRDARP